MKEITKQVAEHPDIAAKQMKQFYDLWQNDAYNDKKGDKVWLEATNIKTNHPMKKLTDKQLGPFEVIKKVG